MQHFKIKNKIIGKKRVFIIAEIGINHNGKFSDCKKLIESAKRSGADAVKLQIINSDESYSENTKSYKVFKKNSLNFIEIKKIKEYAKKLNIIIFATPGDFTSLQIVKKLNFPAIKISSGLLTNIPLIIEVAKLKKPIIISTGLAKIGEIKEAVRTIRKFHNNLAVLKCTSIYPAPLKELNLLSMKTLESKFRKNVIGYSDHALGDLACLTAVSLGAKIIEKHLTLNNKLVGADHKISLMPNQFEKMVNKIRNIEHCLGKENVFPTKYEKKRRISYYRTIVANSFIKKNQNFNQLNISLKRSNIKRNRLHPRNYYKILGKISNRNIKKDNLISLKDIK